MRVQNKVVVVTGASSGIGLSTCERLAAEGAHVMALSRSKAMGLDDGQTIALGAGEVTFVTTDVTDEAAITNAVDVTMRRHGRIDGLFANAGVLHSGASIDATEDEWNRTMDINLTSVWRTVRAVAPVMVAAGSGSIVLNSSINGQRAIGGFSAYTASKFGVIGLGQALAQEVGPAGVRVNSVLPTSTQTPMIDNPAHTERMGGEAQQAFYRSGHMLPVGWIDPTDVANAVLWLLSDEARYITGVSLPVDAGYLAKAHTP
jgi:NAD(P)-dependent dehydrogenase (short-subunit alcohol dehydrogenase family)